MLGLSFFLINIIFNNFYCIVFSQNNNSHLFDGYLLKKFKEVIPDIEDRWNQYKENHNLNLTESEEKECFFVYGKNLIFIEDCKKDNTFEFEVAENDLTHKSREEYFKLLSTLDSDGNVDFDTFDESINKRSEIDVQASVGTIDWRTRNIVTPVKNQGGCGSCYAFSSIAAFESAIAKKYGKQMDLSEQYLIDCSVEQGNNLCRGGKVSQSFSFMMKYSLPVESKYPYKGQNGTCKFTLGTSPPLTTFQRIGMFDENDLAQKVFNIGPVASSIDARLTSFQLYNSGIYSDPSCSSTVVNHGITVVGIMDSPSPHYIIKNSWSSNWGMNGYFLLARNAKNKCGIANQAFVPIL